MKTSILIFCGILYVLNDIPQIILQGSFTGYISIDYGTRIISLFILFKYGMRFKDISLSFNDTQETIAWTFVFIIVGYILFVPVGSILDYSIDTVSLASFPGYPNLFWRLFDLTFGLVLVAISEEVIFRKLLIDWLMKFPLNKTVVMLIAALIFSVIHWSSGIVSIITSFFWSLFPIFYYRETKNLTPCVLGHYFTNLMVFY